MDFKPQKYRFSKADAIEISKIGYQITNKGSITFEKFMQRFFPNFNLISLLTVLENNFTATTQTNIKRLIYFDDINKLLKIEYKNEFINEDDALLFIREFINKDGIIEINHKYCVIPKNSRNNGLIKPVFQESLQQYVSMNARKILLQAGLSGGGYAWAKYGFVAINKNELDAILFKAKLALNRNDFAVVKKIYDIYYMKKPNGKSFPIDLWASLDYMKLILMGSDWHGELDLKNKEQFRNFKNYVSR